MRKTLLLCLIGILFLAISVSGYYENAYLGESGKVFESYGSWEDWPNYIQPDGKKDALYDAGALVLECNQLLDGEDTGASAKIYLMSDWLLHVFIEVTDPELVAPTSEQQVGPANGTEAFDCVTVILDPKNWLDPTDDGDDTTDISDMTRRLRIYRVDHTGFGYVEHDIISDLYGTYFGESLNSVIKGSDDTDASTCVQVEMTDKGYNIEFAAPLQAYAEGTEYGINIILSDAHDGGESVSHYTIASSTNNKEPLNLAKFDYFKLGAKIVELPEETSADTAASTDTSSSDTSSTTTDTLNTDSSDTEPIHTGSSETDPPVNTGLVDTESAEAATDTEPVATETAGDDISTTDASITTETENAGGNKAPQTGDTVVLFCFVAAAAIGLAVVVKRMAVQSK